MSWIGIIRAQGEYEIRKPGSQASCVRSIEILQRHGEAFCPSPGSLDAYIQERARLRSFVTSPWPLKEGCYFGQMGLQACGNAAVMPGRLRLVSFRAGRWRLAIEDLPVCLTCRMDLKDRYRKPLASWTEANMWRELVPASWFGDARGVDGTPELLASDRDLANGLGVGCALRTMLVDPEPAALMGMPLDSPALDRRTDGFCR